MFSWSRKFFKSLNLPDQLVTRHNDPNYAINFGVLPNPDPILAKMGKDQSIYTAMQYDPHIMGELRSLRSGLLGYEWQISPGADDPQSMKAYELIKARLGKNPANGARWNDFFWNIYVAVLNGQSVHEIAYALGDDGYIWPSVLLDRPVRRFRYTLNDELRYLTQNSPLQGEEAPSDYRFLIARHMASNDNPYGVAVMSACFWAYTFKHAGFKWLAKFAEKYGMPWALGKYVDGSDEKTQRELVEGLQNMVEDAVGAIPDSASVQLVETKSSGDPVQERLINLCNREISKALTSQTLATEIQGKGSFAASKTHQGRQDAIAKSDRVMVSETVNQLFEWLTELNFKGATAPVHEFYQEEEARKEWAETFGIAKDYLPISRSFAYERLQITPPAEGDELLVASSSMPHSDTDGLFARGDKGEDFTPDAADGLTVDELMKPIETLLDEAKTLQEFEQGLLDIFPELDSNGIEDYMTLAISLGYLVGMEGAA